jgi:hypothetical protein
VDATLSLIFQLLGGVGGCHFSLILQLVGGVGGRQVHIKLVAILNVKLVLFFVLLGPLCGTKRISQKKASSTKHGWFAHAWIL